MARDEEKQGPRAGERSRHAAAAAREPKPGAAGQDFPVVGIGASAGGLQALTELLGKIPADSGMALVVVTHQHPAHESLLPQLLGRATKLPVCQAEHGLKLRPDHVYVAPPGGHLDVLDGVLLNPQRDESKSPALPVDHFFRSLAADRKERSVCVVLSGTGSDGTLGLKAVKAAGGMAMVQAPGSAEYSGMPASAAATGLADYVMEPAEMPEQLVAYLSGPYLNRDKRQGDSGAIPEDALRQITEALYRRTGYDFAHYKENTTRRRIARRMNVHLISDPREYLRYVGESPHELDLLFKDLLINVTNFFRDPEAWRALAEGPLRELLEGLPEDHLVRAWVPGCTSGEESYSLAIVLREVMQQIGKSFEVQVFGTDLDSDSIDAARAGRYPEGIAADIAPERLERWFVHQDKSYRIQNDIREMVIFAQQNLIVDPPFTRLDLLTCRNVLIYMSSELQKLLIPVFHHALRPGGLLVLGTSESIGDFADLFEGVDKKWKIFRRLETPGRVGRKFGRGLPFLHGPVSPAHRPGPPQPAGTARRDRLIDKAVLGTLCPPSVVATKSGEILQVYGRTGMFLEPSEGEARMNLFAMARKGLPHHLSTLFRKAKMEEKTALRRRVPVKTGGGTSEVDISVTPLREPEALEGLFLVSFELSPRPGKEGPADASGRPRSESGRRIAELERELQEGRQNNQSTTEELETTNEELQSANEELQSANEELQSTNEELESSKEELQSLNEELNTVNNELQTKIEELSHANSDMQNLLENTSIATVFLDVDLNIVRFTEHAQKLIRLAPGDVGRPVGDIVSRFKYRRLEADCREVLRTLRSKELEVETENEAAFTMRIGPYRTLNNVISGVVVTFVPAGEERAYFESIVHTVRHPLVVLDGDMRVISANRAFLRRFKLRPNSVADERIYEIGNRSWDNPELRRLLEEILPRDASFEDFDVELTDPATGAKLVFMLNARRLRRAAGEAGMILLAMEEVSGDPHNPNPNDS